MTLNELRAALDKLVAEKPECGELPVYTAATSQEFADEVRALRAYPAADGKNPARVEIATWPLDDWPE